MQCPASDVVQKYILKPKLPNFFDKKLRGEWVGFTRFIPLFSGDNTFTCLFVNASILFSSTDRKRKEGLLFP
mgnify:FL=1